MSVTISQINVYPVKSARGVSLSNAWVEPIGLSFDRRFMVADSTGQCVTGRSEPKMVEISVSLHSSGITLSHPMMDPLVLNYHQFSGQRVQTHVWKDSFSAYATTAAANAWCSHLLGAEKQLLFTGEESSPRFAAKAQMKVSFADGFPLLLISEASLDELNGRTPDTHTMAQFRPNLVVTDCAAFAEDSWAKIEMGSVVFRVAYPCSRSIFTTLDLASGDFRPNKEPLATLSQFRSDNSGKVNFGIYLIALNEGEIRVGDELKVLEYGEAAVYSDNRTLNVGV